MTKLLSILLSFTLLFCTTVPTYAQGGLPEGVQKTVQAAREIDKALEGSRAVEEITRLTRSLDTPIVDPAIPYNTITPAVETFVRQAVLGGNLTAQEINLRALQDRTAFLPDAILSFPDIAERTALLRGAFVSAAANGSATETQLRMAAGFWRSDLLIKLDAFNETASASPRALEALADTAALGVFGTAEDISLLMDVFTHAQHTTWSYAATAHVARGLLRLGAYEQLAHVLESVPGEGMYASLRNGIITYAREHNLPLHLSAVESTSQVMDEPLHNILAPYGKVNALAADPSAQATRQWMAWGHVKPAVTEDPQPRWYSTGAGQPGSTGSQPRYQPASTASSDETTSASYSGLSPINWVQRPVLNALGQQIMGWVPSNTALEVAAPANTVRPLTWKDRWVSFTIDLQNFSRSLWHTARSRMGALTLASGLAGGASSLEATVLQRAALEGGLTSAPVMQPIISPKELWVAALPGSPEAVNPGGVSAQRAAFSSLYPAAQPARVGSSGMLFSSFFPFSLSSWWNKPTISSGSQPAAQPVQSHPGMRRETLSLPITFKQQLLMPLMTWAPGIAQRPWFQRALGPTTEDVYYRYQRVVYNTKNQRVRAYKEGEKLGKDERVYRMAQQYFFMAPPEVPLQAIAADVTAQFTKEAAAAGRKVDNKELQKAIEQAQHRDGAATAIRQADLLARYILDNARVTRNDLIWILASSASVSYKLRASRKLAELGFPAATQAEVLAKRVAMQRQSRLDVKLNKTELETIESKVAVRLQLENQGHLVPQDDPLLAQGLTHRQLTDVDQNLLTEALYPSDEILELLTYSTHETVGGNTVYEKVLPVYVRNAEGDVSGAPQLYLLLSTPFTMPRGFRAVIDESGHFKVAPHNLRAINSSRQPYNALLRTLFKLQPSFLDDLPWVVNNPRRLLNWDSSVRRRVFETPLKASELTALSYILSQRPDQVAVLPTAQKDTFDALMGVLALIAGADLGASMSSQLKKTIAIGFFVIVMSGFGYLSPLCANFFKAAIKKYGYYSVTRGGLLAMLGVSALGVASGMWGTFEPDANAYNMGMAITFMATAIIVASVFSTLASQMLKSAYPDDVVFSSKNMSFTTNKGLSRLLVTGGVAALFPLLQLIKPAEWNWTVLVPVMMGLNLLGLKFLKGSRLYTEHAALQAAQKQGGTHVKTQQELELEAQAQTAAKAEEKRHKAEMKAKYEELFAKPLKPITTRLGLIYLSYAVVNSIIIGVAAGTLYNKSTALAISCGGLFISWLVRKFADKLIKSRVITDDQLTGIALPLMFAGIAGGLFAPFGSSAMFLSWFLMYLATPTFGVSESTRMMNFIGSYYKAAREQVGKDKTLTVKQQEAQAKALKAEEKDMKVEAGGAYNTHNSWGIFTILALGFMTLFGKDFASEAFRFVGPEAQAFSHQIAAWFEQVAGLFRFGADSAAYMPPAEIAQTMNEEELAKLIAKAKSAPLDFAIYRLSMLAPVVFSSILMWTNRGMIRQGFNRLLRSIILTPQAIAGSSSADITRRLQVDFAHTQATVAEIAKEAEELKTQITPFKNSRTSEDRLQAWANRLVWINNRLKAVSEYSPLLADKLVPERALLRQTAATFVEILNHNDVSDALREQGRQIYDSLVNGPARQAARYTQQQQDFLAYLEKIAPSVPASKQAVFTRWVEQLRAQAAAGNADGVQQLVDALDEKAFSSKRTQQRVIQLATSLTQAMHAAAQEPDLLYLPEVKLSFVDAMRQSVHHLTGLGTDPAAGIFSGTEVQAYEQAKFVLVELNNMLSEAKNGIIADGMFDTFQATYDQGIGYLQHYIRQNRMGRTTEVDSRVALLKEQFDAVYRQYMNKDPQPVQLIKDTPPSSAEPELLPAPAQ